MLFTDYGSVRIDRKRFAPGSNTRNLGAAGLGVTLAKSRDFFVRGYWAGKALTREPATSDPDGAHRAWLQAEKSF